MTSAGIWGIPAELNFHLSPELAAKQENKTRIFKTSIEESILSVFQ